MFDALFITFVFFSYLSFLLSCQLVFAIELNIALYTVKNLQEVCSASRWSYKHEATERTLLVKELE